MLSELDEVVLLSAVDAEDDEAHVRMLPEGSRGTVVCLLGTGEGYTVEFEQPFHALVEVTASNIRAVAGAMREKLIATSVSE